MSHMFRDSMRADLNIDGLQNTNQTSGYFLGAVPRQWMRNTGDVNNGAEISNSNTARKAGSKSTPQKQTPVPPASTPQSAHALTEARIDGSVLAPQVTLSPTAAPNIHNLTANHIVDLNSSAVNLNSNISYGVDNDIAEDLATFPSPQGIPAAISSSSFDEFVNFPVYQDVPPQQQAVDESNVAETSTPSGTVHPSVDVNPPQHDSARVPLSDDSHQHQNAVFARTSSAVSPPTGLDTPLNQTTDHINNGSLRQFNTQGRNRRQTLPSISPAQAATNVQQTANIPTSPHFQPALTPRLDLLQELDLRVQALSAIHSFGPADKNRIEWLQSACRYGDTFYLLLHQFACIHFIQPSFLPATSLLDAESLAGLVLFNQVLRNSGQIIPPLMSVFAYFVARTETIQTDVSIKSWLPKLRQFLRVFVFRWASFQNKMFQYRIPPSAFQLYAEFGAYDAVLSQSIYRECIERLFPHADRLFYQNAMQLFKHSQEALYGNLQNHSSGVPWNMIQAQEIRQFAIKFRQMSTAEGLPRGAFRSTTHHQAVNNDGSHSRPLSSMSPPQTVPGGIQLQQLQRQVAQQRNISQQVAQSHVSPQFFPRPGQILPITTNPNPARGALHQAHLASPILAQTSDTRSDGHQFPLYSFLHDVLGGFKTIDQNTIFETWTIRVSSDVLNHRVRELPLSKDDLLGRPKWSFENSTFMFHLRCVENTSIEKPLGLSSHSASATFWPEHLFISINGHHLEFRRKVHHGKDLPVDVTSFLQETNEVELSYHANQRELGRTFVIALEVITVLEHSKVLELPHRIDAQTSLSTITQLQQDHAHDDDLILNIEHTTIDLIDPFTARMFEQPARGNTCRHRECFDLEAFLQSRRCRNKDGLVHPDEWKCPICSRDARPSSLMIDEFLLRVKESLIRNGKQDTKAILVKSDGSWEAKLVDSTAPGDVVSRNSRESTTKDLEPTTDDGVDAKGLTSATTQRQGSHTASNEPVVIDLMDDED